MASKETPPADLAEILEGEIDACKRHPLSMSKASSLAFTVQKHADVILKAVRGSTEWSPDMDSAPRDGTVLDLYRADAGSFVGWYGTCETLHMTEREIEELSEESYFAESWWGLSQDGAARLEGVEVPTHWRPRPADPPADTQEETQ